MVKGLQESDKVINAETKICIVRGEEQLAAQYLR